MEHTRAVKTSPIRGSPEKSAYWRIKRTNHENDLLTNSDSPKSIPRLGDTSKDHFCFYSEEGFIADLERPLIAITTVDSCSANAEISCILSVPRNGVASVPASEKDAGINRKGQRGINHHMKLAILDIDGTLTQTNDADADNGAQQASIWCHRR